MPSLAFELYRGQAICSKISRFNGISEFQEGKTLEKADEKYAEWEEPVVRDRGDRASRKRIHDRVNPRSELRTCV